MITTVLLILILCIQVGIFIAVFRKKNDTASIQQDEKLIALKTQLEALERGQRELSKELRTEQSTFRKELADQVMQNRKEQSLTLSQNFENMRKQLVELTQTTMDRLERMRTTVQSRLEDLQKDNGQRIEKMQAIVDEKLQSTLEKRISQSFELVSKRLDQVSKDLGEVNALSSGMTDLKRVLTNVKTRGTWGEAQLGALLEQVLAPGQFAKNVKVKPGSNEIVEYAICLPGKADGQKVLYLPIDSKFPIEDYQRLVIASEQANVEDVEQFSKKLVDRVKSEAKDIKNKYIAPPHTTDFAILYLPIEGLYAEVLRVPGLPELLQREYKVSLAGPSNLVAILSALQMGFQTLAIQKYSSQVWGMLNTVKTEFGKFGDLLAKAKEKMQGAANSLEDVEKKSATIQKKLRNVEALPAVEVSQEMEMLASASISSSEDV